MQPEAPRRFGDVAVGIGQDAVDVLPLDTSQRRNLLRHFREIVRCTLSWNPYRGQTLPGSMNRFKTRGTVSASSRPQSAEPRNTTSERPSAPTSIPCHDVAPALATTFGARAAAIEGVTAPSRYRPPAKSGT